MNNALYSVKIELGFDPNQPRDPDGKFASAGGESFPSSGTKGLRSVRSLGGSTGAVLYKDSNGNMFVKKTGASREHAENEHEANKIYEAMGVRVPASKMYDGYVLNKFIEGRTLNSLSSEEREAAYAKLREDFVADAVLGNWDVIGLDEDNVIVDHKGKVWRIDNGGAMKYRAQGRPKGSAWNDKLAELDSMRDMGTAGRVYGKVSDDDIARQARALLKRQDKIRAASSDPVLHKRLDELEKRYGQSN